MQAPEGVPRMPQCWDDDGQQVLPQRRRRARGLEGSLLADPELGSEGLCWRLVLKVSLVRPMGSAIPACTGRVFENVLFRRTGWIIGSRSPATEEALVRGLVAKDVSVLDVDHSLCRVAGYTFTPARHSFAGDRKLIERLEDRLEGTLPHAAAAAKSSSFSFCAVAFARAAGGSLSEGRRCCCGSLYWIPSMKATPAVRAHLRISRGRALPASLRGRAAQRRAPPLPIMRWRGTDLLLALALRCLWKIR